MTFVPHRRAPRAFAVLAVMVALVASLTVPVAALGATSTITQQDCEQGTIKDKSGNAISRARCEELVGKSVELANTGFAVWPLVAGGAVLLVGAAAFGLRRGAGGRLAS
jgi:hypothetical protein